MKGFFTGALRGYGAIYEGYSRLYVGVFCCYLLSSSTYQPDIGSLSIVILTITGW